MIYRHANTYHGGLFGSTVVGEPTAPNNGTATSKAAAESLSPNQRQSQRNTIAALVADSPGGLTREQIEDLTGLSGNTVRPRVAELIAAGILTEQGTRKTKSGREANVIVRGMTSTTNRKDHA